MSNAKIVAVKYAKGVKLSQLTFAMHVLKEGRTIDPEAIDHPLLHKIRSHINNNITYCVHC